MLLLIIIAVFFVLYTILLLWFWKAWISIPPFIGLEKYRNTRFSIIIPARNEENNIGNLLDALKNQEYPNEKFEIIVVDDHSTDGTASIVKKYEGVRLISLVYEDLNSYKKKAIETGIAAARFEWILTTDADCIPGPDWLATFDAFRKDYDPAFIVAPVVMENDLSALQLFQSEDFMILQAITGAAVSGRLLTMCNGANLLYSKNLFTEVGGFGGIDNIASGDDMLLMGKVMKSRPGAIYYLKSREAIVRTKPMATWKEFFNQRIRWASKSRNYSDKKLLPVLLLVYLVNLAFPILIVASVFCPFYWAGVFIFWLAKTIVEMPLFISTARFFRKRPMIIVFFLFQPLHIFYTIIAGFLGQAGKYEWKGRRVS
jgi:poly-beta-1,6-N-acetyl-D-glucosamine synthase